MNENINLCEILKNCSKDIKLYCTFLGDVLFSKIENNKIFVHIGNTEYSFYSDGKFICNGECVIFPSKEQRDWSKFERFWDKPKVEKFDPKTLQTFDRVLVRDYSSDYWNIDLFSYKKDKERPVRGLSYWWKQCIPYNEETKHILGTTEDCPEYYKWWKK